MSRANVTDFILYMILYHLHAASAPVNFLLPMIIALQLGIKYELI